MLNEVKRDLDRTAYVIPVGGTMSLNDILRQAKQRGSAELFWIDSLLQAPESSL